MTNGTYASWESKDGYIKYFLSLRNDGWFLWKRDLNARISTRELCKINAFSAQDAVSVVEAKIRPDKYMLTRA